MGVNIKQLQQSMMDAFPFHETFFTSFWRHPSKIYYSGHAVTWTCYSSCSVKTLIFTIQFYLRTALQKRLEKHMGDDAWRGFITKPVLPFQSVRTLTAVVYEQSSYICSAIALNCICMQTPLPNGQCKFTILISCKQFNSFLYSISARAAHLLLGRDKRQNTRSFRRTRKEPREHWSALPKLTLLQTWGHLNICLQHVRQEFNQSPLSTYNRFWK